MRRSTTTPTARRATLALVLASLLAWPGANVAGAPARASRGAIAGTPRTGQPGITRSVRELMARPDPNAGKKVAPFVLGEEDEEEREGRRRVPVRQHPLAPKTSAWPLAAAGPPQGDNPLSTGVSFLAASSRDSFFVPPDSMGDVGPTQILVMVNGYIRVLDKQGNPGALQMPADVFWGDVHGNASTSDPQVRYDRLSERWFLSMITLSGTAAPNRLLLAVSSGPVIDEATTFTFYFFEPDDFSPAPNEDTGAFADFASLGVDANAVYLSANMYRPDFKPFGPSLFVIRKSSMLAGGPLVATAFRQISTFETGGIGTPRAVSNDDPGATEGYFVGHDLISYGVLNLRRVTDPGGTPSLSPDIPIAVPTTTQADPVVFRGSMRPISSGGIALLGAELFQNRITGERSLWTAHMTGVDASGVATSGSDRAASRWYEIVGLSTTPALRQSGTVFDPKPTRPRSFIFPSVAMSGQGTAVLGATSGGRDNRAEVSVTARLSGDPLGTSRAPEAVVVSEFDYNLETGTVLAQRWGDYSRTVVDPTDGMTFWTFQEYCDGPTSWAVRVVEIQAPPPLPIAAVSPATAAIGTRVECVVAGAPDGVAGYFDPGAGFAKRLAVQVGGGGVTVENVRLVDATRVAFTLVVAPDAAMGPRDVTVVNPDGQSVFAAGALDVGPLVTSVRVGPTPDGSGKLVVKGAGFAGQVTVLLDGVAFAGPARSTGGRKVVQKGRLANGATVNQAIRPGSPALITIVNATGGSAQYTYTR